MEEAGIGCLARNEFPRQGREIFQQTSLDSLTRTQQVVSGV